MSQAQIIPLQPAREQVARELRLPKGRLIELSGNGAVARMTLATLATVQAQAEGDPCAWIQAKNGGLYPPDLAASGVDLRALIVVHVPPDAGAVGRLRAAEILLRSGGFGLVTLDLRQTTPPNNTAWQGRLLGIAREHQSCVLMLTDSAASTGSLGSLVSLRLEPLRSRVAPGRFTVEPRILKNKLGDFFGATSPTHRGPAGFW